MGGLRNEYIDSIIWVWVVYLVVFCGPRSKDRLDNKLYHVRQPKWRRTKGCVDAEALTAMSSPRVVWGIHGSLSETKKNTSGVQVAQNIAWTRSRRGGKGTRDNYRSSLHSCKVSSGSDRVRVVISTRRSVLNRFDLFFRRCPD
jgi:hypothetical protein